MTADNVVNFPRKRIAAFTYATGSVPSWSTRLGAGVRRSWPRFGGNAMGDMFERLDAELAISEAEYRKMELCVAEMAKFESQMWPEHLADLAIARAQLKARWVELDQTYRARRRAKAQVIWSGVKRILIWGFVFWFVLTFMKGAQAQSTLRSFYNERGSFAGSSVTRGNSSSFYDGQGRFSGSAIRHGNSTSFYDRNGHYTGSVIDTLPKR
jgi:hypothetical protein